MDMKLTIAHYGHAPSRSRGVDFSGWWRDQDALAERLQVDLTYVNAAFLQRPSRLSDDKAYRLPRYKKRFMREIEAGNVVRLALDSLVTRPDGLLTYDWDLSANLGEDPTCSLLSCTGVDVRHLEGAGERFARDLIEQTRVRDSKQLVIEYGFAVVMERDFLPTGYAMGLGSDMPDYLIYDGKAWRDFAGKQCDHRLRNVFGYNVINQKHLDIQVGGKRLEQWIGVSDHRGRIQELGDDLFAWTFAQDEKDTDFLAWDYPPVEEARRELEKFSIFPWQEIVE